MKVGTWNGREEYLSEVLFVLTLSDEGQGSDRD